MLKNLFAFVLFALSAMCVWSQTERGSIRGTIFDPSGAVVPGVTVIATNTSTNITLSTTTTSSGVYDFPSLPPSTYRVQVQQQGFKQLNRENVIVGQGAVIGLDLTLEVGATNEVITVNTSAPILKTESSEVSTSVTAQAYMDLPLTSAGGGRYAGGFLQLVPGWTNGGTATSAVQHTMADSMNGGQLSSKDIQIEGVTTIIMEIPGDARNTVWPPDVLQELSVTTNGYSAEYGSTGGGVERYELKSGTNGVHGNAYEFIRNTVLDARGFFNTVRPIHKENEFGFTVGLPIVIPKLYNGKNKTFLFFGLNEYQYRSGAATQIISLPNAAFRSGDFSGLNSNQLIYDPATTQTLSNGTVTRQVFPGNKIPQSRFSAAAVNMLKYVPQSQTQSIYNNYFAPVNTNFNNNAVYTVKGDQYFGSKHHLTISNVYADNPVRNTGILSQPIETGNGPLKTYTYDFGRLTEDWTISSRLLNQFRIGFNRQVQNARSGQLNDPANGWLANLGVPGLQAAYPDFPIVNWGSFQTLSQSRVGNSVPVSNTYILADNLTLINNSHSIKFGFEGRNENHYFININPVTLNFSANETALPTALSTTGLPFASFLLGQVDSATVPVVGPYAPHNTVKQFGIFVQDDYKVKPKLTVNLGVRWDLFTPLQESHNWYSVMDPTVPNPAAGNLPGAYVFAGQGSQGNRLSFAKDNTSNFSPRLGLAWRLKDRFVVRAGYGISYFQTGAYGGGNNTQILQGYWFTSSAQSLNSGVTPAFVLDQGFPSSALVNPPYLNPGLGVGTGNIQYWDPSAARAAYMQNWNFTTQTQLSGDMSLELAYVGSKGTHLPASDVDSNQLDPRYYRLGTLLNSNINSPAVAALGFRPPYPGFNGSLAQALRPFPQYVSSLQYELSSATVGSSTYHALQAQFMKRFSHGIYGQLSYQWGKNLTDSMSNYVNNGVAGRDNYNRRLDKVVMPYFRPHRVVAAVTYELPFGPGKSFATNPGLVGKLVGGWKISGLVSYASGTPVQVTAPQTLPLNVGPQTPNSVLGTSPNGSWTGQFDPATDRYLNASAFSLPASYTFGTSPLYLSSVRTPNSDNEDVALMKTTNVKERFNVQFRFEAYNVLNRVVFAAPAANLGVPQTFGVVSAVTNTPRSCQGSIKLTF